MTAGNGVQGRAGERRFFCREISEYSEKWFYERSFFCGPSSAGLFRELLGLAGHRRILLKSVAWEKDRFNIALYDRSKGRSPVLVLKRYADEELSLYAKYEFRITDNGFVLLYRKEEAGRDLDGVLDAFLSSLGRIDPPELFHAVYSGARRKVRFFRPEGAGAEEPAERPEFYQWGREGISRTFMLNEVLLDQLCGEIDFKENSRNLRIKCGDIECFNKYHPLFISEPEALIFNTCGKYRTFLENLKSRGEGREREDLFFQKIMLANSLIEFGEKEVVFGSDRKIFRILGDIVKIIRKKGISLSVVDTCINRIIGSDLDSFVKQLKKKNRGLNIVYEGQHNNPMEKELIKKEFSALILRSLKSRAGKRPAARSINLVGFEEDRSTGELSGLLEKFFQIRVNMVLLPRVDPALLGRFNRAGVQVVNFFRVYAGTFKSLVSGRGGMGRTLFLPPPYGMRETVRWLTAVTRAFGISMNRNREWNEYYQDRMAGFSRQARKALSFRLGLIISGSDIGPLLDPSRFLYGIPLLACLEEMGFGLNILVASGSDFDSRKQALLRLLRHKERHRIELLNEPDRWEKWILRANARCIYSDFQNDARIIQNGRNPFSLFLLEKGMDGALRAQKEFLRLCAMDFNEKYRVYKKSAARPLPDEEALL